MVNVLVTIREGFAQTAFLQAIINPQSVIHLNHLYLQGYPPSLCHSLTWDEEKIESHDNNNIHKTISPAP